MKRLLLAILSLSIIIGLAACGNKQNEVKEEDSQSMNVESEKKDASENKQNDQEIEIKKDLLTGTYKVPLQDVYVDIPAFNMFESGFARLFMVNDSRYVSFICLYEEKETDEKHAWETTFNTLKDSLFGYHKVNFLNEVEETFESINGIETYRIKGTVNCGETSIYDAYIYGYSFVFNDYPCSIVGVVEDKAQLQEDIDNVTEIVDAMMASVRSEK